MVTIVAPDDNDFSPPRVPAWDQVVQIQPGQLTSQHENRKCIIPAKHHTTLSIWSPIFKGQPIQVPVIHGYLIQIKKQ